MKKVLLAIAAMALAALPAAAQTQVDIGASTQSITFTGTGAGGNVNIQLGSCSGGTCTLSGNAFLDSNPSGVNGAYAFTTSSSNSIQLHQTLTSGYYTVSQTGDINFSWGGGSLLTGKVTLVDFQQTPGSPTGDFNGSLGVNLQITGGSEASLFTNNQGILSFTVKVKNSTDIGSLFGTTNSATASITTGNITPTPEPGSMLLFGTGLVGLGGYLRRRIA